MENTMIACDNDIKREKIKVTSLDVIVTMIEGKPYYEIKYKRLGNNYCNIGYSSYNLENVLKWRDEYFELVNEQHVERPEEIQQYRAIGTVEECRAAVEKQKAKAPLYRQGTRYRWIDSVREGRSYINVPKYSNRDACPSCKKDILKENYCRNCGQKIDWSDNG